MRGGRGQHPVGGLARQLAATGDTARAAALAQRALKDSLQAGYRGLVIKALDIFGWDVRAASEVPAQLVGALADPDAART